MEKRSKDLLRALVKELRRIFVGTMLEDSTVQRGDLDRQLERIGIAPDGSITPLDAVSGDLRTYRIAVTQLLPLLKAQRISMRSDIVERAAYTWINRLLALRAMETRGLIDDALRGNQDYHGLSEKLFILRQTEPARAAGDDGGWWAVLEDACTAQAQALPGPFALDDPAAALRPSTAALLQAIELVNGSKQAGFTPDESDAAFRDPDAIGWAYQFYQEESKKQIDAKCKNGGKVVNRAEIAAKTQLFTEPYMVQWLLQNSLGRSYAEAYSHSTLPQTWAYYVKPEQPNTAPPFSLASLTLLDPCMGSGHFLRAAFDMFVAMYREQYPTFTAQEIADRILTNHLYGIDIDPRAAQLTALSLYLRAWELVRSESHMATYTPPPMNLATTPTNLNKGALQRHLERYPRDMALKPLLEGIFSALEQADMLGSLLRPREYIDTAINKLKEDHTLEMDFNLEAAELRRTILEISKHSPDELKRLLFTTVLESFHREAGNTDDVSAVLFGREVEQGIHLLQLLDHRYAIVVTNPPYMGSKYMDTPLKKYVEKHYAPGKRDLYAAFILRCLELCEPNGRVAMVTQQSWMFFKSYIDLRATSEEKLEKWSNNENFKGILRETSLEVLAHLGANAFEEISGEVVQPVLFTIYNKMPHHSHHIASLRLVGLKDSSYKAEMLRKVTHGQAKKNIYRPLQLDILAIPGTSIVYWLEQKLFDLLSHPHLRFSDLVTTRYGMNTGNNNRFVRYYWEELYWRDRWVSYAKGGGYAKWSGLEWFILDWKPFGNRLRLTNGAFIRNPQFYFHEGITYSRMAGGSLGTRYLPPQAAFDSTSLSMFPIAQTRVSFEEILSVSNSRLTSYLLRVISSDIEFNPGYVDKTPFIYPTRRSVISLVRVIVELKRYLVARILIEQSFKGTTKLSPICGETLLHTLEGLNEQVIVEGFDLSAEAIQTVLEETGTPAGWYPLIANYDTLPPLPDDLELPPLPQELHDYLAAHERIHPNAKELARIKANLKALYEAGPGAKNVEQQESDEPAAEGEGDEEETIAAGAHIPIPTETFLEELSVKLELHPISVYWLLEELRTEGVRCKPEALRVLEDRLSVIVLRLLGHRWPKQLEANEPVPTWAVTDGIIPLVAGTGKPTLANQVRGRLREEDGDLGVQRTESLLSELTGLTLEEWLRKRFFARHASQFKLRPIGWHLASTPTRIARSSSKRKGGSSYTSRGPAFECLLYYHACTRDALARIRTQYVEPLIQAERNASQPEELFSEDTATAITNERVRELEAFVEKLGRIEEQGFSCSDLTWLIEAEPLDRWCGNGYVAPLSHDALLRNEAAWHVDINDGVRVNIAPLQLASVLASDVLKTNDAKKALADRAHWRADERRWVREGKLPRCGWMSDDVPESPRWQELHKQDNATQEASQELQLLPLMDVDAEKEVNI